MTKVRHHVIFEKKGGILGLLNFQSLVNLSSRLPFQKHSSQVLQLKLDRLGLVPGIVVAHFVVHQVDLCLAKFYRGDLSGIEQLFGPLEIQFTGDKIVLLHNNNKKCILKSIPCIFYITLQ